MQSAVCPFDDLYRFAKGQHGAYFRYRLQCSPSVGAERRAVIEVLAASANPEVAEFPTGKTPLMFACQYGSVPTIKALLAGNADIEPETCLTNCS